MAIKAQDYDYLVKVVIVGDSGVGKTCLLVRYTEQNFITHHLVTIGIDFKFKNLEVNGKRLRLQIWDTAGQERFRTIANTYYRSSSGIILAYSSGDRSSFNNVENWLKQINANADESVCKIIVATKCDLDSIQVDPSEGRKLAEKHGLKFFETSAKESVNVDECFGTLARDILQQVLAREKHEQSHIAPVSQGSKLTQMESKKKSDKKCCDA
eukprot:TRINITY_DN13225_c0_g2_i1.p1 TRINITY_DN13225_c0_g2~~TRINITY_DN13225_c0_g2_i1.p1  ORF type:complete len:212 (+),score=17.95 TRINITY_DN13225_c0_g2_i1:122-757(+)